MNTFGKNTVKIKKIFEDNSSLELAILIGSRTNNNATTDSDWDFAIQWQRDISQFKQLQITEELRNKLSKALNTPSDKIDLINIPTAGLAISEIIANEGNIIKGENTLALSRFLLKTWRTVEEFYWESLYAA